MSFKRLALGLATAACLSLGAATALAGDWNNRSVRFADDYAGYHLRPPYYLPGTGWHTPPTHRTDRGAYYGYHFHGDHPPRIDPGREAVVVYRPVARYRVLRSEHVAWCHGRYRSYRPHDNTFQPNHGARRQCWSPYG